MVTIDLKDFENVNILWMVCGFTRPIKGIILKEKVGEMKDCKMEEFRNRLGLKVVFVPAILLWLNGLMREITIVLM